MVKMNGKHIHFYREVSSYSMFHAGETVEVTYERDGKRYTAELTPLYDEELGRYRYGFVSGWKWRKEMCLRIFCTVDMR